MLRNRTPFRLSARYGTLAWQFAHMRNGSLGDRPFGRGVFGVRVADDERATERQRIEPNRERTVAIDERRTDTQPEVALGSLLHGVDDFERGGGHRDSSFVGVKLRLRPRSGDAPVQRIVRRVRLRVSRSARLLVRQLGPRYGGLSWGRRVSAASMVAGRSG